MSTTTCLNCGDKAEYSDRHPFELVLYKDWKQQHPDREPAEIKADAYSISLVTTVYCRNCHAILREWVTTGPDFKNEIKDSQV